jgi:hypothetical protein
MERLVKAMVCPVDGMASSQVRASALTGRSLANRRAGVGWVVVRTQGLVVAGRLLGWHDAPG